VLVTRSDIMRGISELKLAGLPLCAHTSLKSFGRVEGGAGAIVDAFLAAGCTLVVPAFRYTNEIAPPRGVEIERNGWDSGRAADVARYSPEPFDPDSNSLEPEGMGAVPAAVLDRAGRQRGNHPIDSFSALGPLAEEIIATQTPHNVYGPLRSVGQRGGYALLMGVGLNRMTLLHTAEEEAGRELFQRWALDRDGRPIACRIGGCSEGFPRLEASIGRLARETTVGNSGWRAFPINATLAAAAAAISSNPNITHCGSPACGACPDAVLGGPLIA
jgi:aminoglycoside 3-N-acetyltransferase